MLSVVFALMFAGFFVLLIASGVADAAFGLAGAVLLITALWHLIVGHSWLSIIPVVNGRKASASISGAAVLFAGIGVVLPSSEDASSAVLAPLASVSATASESATEPSSPSPSPSPSSAEPTPSPTPTTVTPEPSVDDAVVLAVHALEELSVKGRAPKTDYSRDRFGQRWADIDRNGCDQRNDVLGRDLVDVTHKPGTQECVVLTGVLDPEPFTGGRIDFVRGNKTSSEVQIDHVVALSDGWQKGAQKLTEKQRLFFANDPLNLLAVDGPSNQAKGDGDAATWLPKNKAFRCEYVAIQVAVKHKYGLWVTQAEHDAIARVLEGCPEQALPEDSGIEVPEPSETMPAQHVIEPTASAKATKTAKPKPTATKAEPEGGDVYYKNCTAVREAGKAPIHRGEPGYAKRLDRDGDGVGCE